MHLTVHVDDRQIMLYLAERFAAAGLAPVLFDPTQLGCAGPFDLILRFFPAEWLPRLPWRTRWQRLIDGPMLVCNPVTAVLSQSKRFPLVWDRLTVPLPTWRALLPETRRPQHVPRGEEHRWVFKPALGHEGHHVGVHGVTAAAEWRSIRRRSWWNPRGWAAQRRFTPAALPTPDGPLYPCLGVYVVDGRAAGAFGRVSSRRLTDERSREIIVLIAPSRSEGSGHAAGRDS